MKVFTWLMAAALLCSTQISYADEECCDTCSFDFCDVTYAVYADYLYWQVCRSDLNYTDSVDTANVEKYINPGYTSAYRLGVVFSYDVWDLGVNYTSFCDSTSGSSPIESIKYKVDYQVVNIELARALACGCDQAVFTPFIGTKLAWIDETKWNDDIKTQKDHTSYGLYLGSHLRWDLCSFDMCDWSIPVALVSRGSFGVQHATVSQKDINFINKNQCLYIPVIEAFVGLDFTFCDVYCGTNGNLQIGYEVQSFSSVRGFNSASRMASLGIGGLVTRFGLSF